ncbi:MAG: glycerol kinase [Actinobacteria bacterium 13_2_20CM_2_72_6]|nr:MAG: glycerol kinase [Actinobacteria bacterium 13_2_20CM_2_72_6]
MTSTYLAAIDQGTTSTRCIVFDVDGRIVALDRAGLSRADIAAIGITNQRETTLVWDAETGEPVHPAIVWQDTRTDRIIRELAGDAGSDRFRAACGLPLATYFAGPKVRWLLDNVPGLDKRAERGEVLFGTIDTWLIWQLTGRHATDVTNASRTMLMGLSTLDWDPALLDAFGVPRAMLPEILPSSHVYGEARGDLGGVPVASALGDQSAALFGQTCFDPGQAKCTYGTGSFLLLNGIISSAPEINELAAQVEDNGGCYFVPAFSGLFAPYWRPDARGVIAGLTGYVTKAHLARAALEATAWQVKDVVDAMAADSHVELNLLNVDGGMTASTLLMQFQADVLDVPVVRPTVAETTSLGAAYAAGLAVGYWPDLDTLRAKWEADARWEPAMPAPERDRAYRLWRKAVDRTLGWLDES